MGFLAESASWSDGIPYFEANAVLTGGPDCPDNVPIAALANRTVFLKKQIDDAVSGALTLMYASKLKTSRSISMTGDARWSVNFDGAGNVSDTLILSDTGITSGTYPVLTVNSKGLAISGRALLAADIPTFDWAKIVSGKPSTLAGYGITDAAPLSQLTVVAPPGLTAYFSMNAAPAGWLVADGSAVSRTTYSALFAAIGTTFGAGNGSTTFNLPDLRGQFIRGWSGPTGTIDSGRAFGSAQGDLIKLSDVWASYWLGASPPVGSTYPVVATQSASQNASYQSFPSSSNAETRPRNIALLACIKI